MSAPEKEEKGMEGEWDYHPDPEPPDVCWLCGGPLDSWGFCAKDCTSLQAGDSNAR